MLWCFSTKKCCIIKFMQYFQCWGVENYVENYVEKWKTFLCGFCRLGGWGNRAALFACVLGLWSYHTPHTIYYIILYYYTIYYTTIYHYMPPYTIYCHRPIISTVYYTIYNNTIYKSIILYITLYHYIIIILYHTILYIIYHTI